MRALRPLALLLALSAAGCGGGGKIALRYHPRAGGAFRYALEQASNFKFDGGPFAAAPAQDITLHLEFTQRVSGPALGGTSVSVVIDTAAMSAPGMPEGMLDAQLAGVRGLTGEFVFDERMVALSSRYSNAQGTVPALVEQMKNGLTVTAFPLPADPVGTGDSWTAEVDLPMQLPGATGGLRAHNTLTLRDVQTSGGDTIVVIAVETRFPDRPVTITRQGQTATVSMTGTLSGEQTFSLTRGTALGSHMAGTLHMAMTMPGAPAGMSLTLRQETTLKLLPGGGS
jgi:hypothetical protein